MNTVRAAYAKLETDGLVQTRHGVGTVVVESAPRAAAGGAVAFGANTIAVLIGGLDPFYLPLLRGIEEVASERGTLVLIVDTRDSASLAQAMIRRLVARGVDGIIAVSIGDLPPDRSGPDDTPLPIVYVDQPDRRGYSLVFDGADAGYTATDHLRRHGHDRIGFVTAPLVWHNVAELHHGYLRALESADVVPSPEPWPRCRTSPSRPDASRWPGCWSCPIHPPRSLREARTSRSEPWPKPGHEACGSRTTLRSWATPTRLSRHWSTRH